MWSIARWLFGPRQWVPTGLPEVDRLMRSTMRNAERMYGAFPNPKYQEEGDRVSLSAYFEKTMGLPPPPKYAEKISEIDLESPQGTWGSQIIDRAAAEARREPFPKFYRTETDSEVYYSYEDFVAHLASHLSRWFDPPHSPSSS